MDRSLLVIEANPSEVWLMKFFAQNLPYPVAVQSVHDGPAALETLRLMDTDATVPHLILLGYHLPGVSSFDILQFIAARPVLQRTPVVVIGPGMTPEERQALLKAGAADVFRTSSNFAELEALYDRLFRLWLKGVKPAGES